MKKRILSMILAIAMVVSVFAGIAVTASAAGGTYVLTDAIAVGDTIVMGYAAKNAVLTDVAKIGSNMCGISGEATFNGNNLTAETALELTVEQGSAEGSVAFKTPAGQYLTWLSGNTLDVADEISDSASWTVTISEGAATIINVADTARYLQFNASSPRFCAYKNTGKNVGLYKPAEGDVCDHAEATSEVTLEATCTEAGTEKFTCPCGEEWEKSIPAKGHTNDEGVVTAEPTCTVPGTKTYTCTTCGETKADPIDALGHDYVEGVCTRCNEAQPAAKTFVAVAADAIVAGNYILAVDRNGSSEYPTVYPAGSAISGGHWVVSDSTVAAAADFTFSSEDLPADAVVFTLEGNNTDGFTVSYTNANGEVLYLGYSTYAKAKNAFAAEYNTFKWKVVTNDKGNVGLQTGEGDSIYTISAGQTTSNTALRGYVSGTIYNSIYFFKEIGEGDELPCTHPNTEEIPATEATCTTAGNTAGVKCVDCGMVISGNEYVEATGHNFSATVVDGVVTMVCSVCDASETVALNTLAEAKAYTDTSTVYNVKGVVTYVSGRTVYIEDENDGLCVYFHYDVDTSALNLGDEIFVSSTMTVYNGLIETNSPTSYVLISTGNAVPNNTELTVAELMADTANTYLGERVTLSNLTAGAIDSKGTLTLTDEDGNTITIYRATGIDAIVTEGDVITVTAVVSIYKTTYQLVVNPATMASDIVIGGTPEPDPEPEEVAIKLGHTLNLASDISINFAATTASVADYTEFYLECTIPVYEGNTKTGSRTVTIQPEYNGSYYYFMLNGITAINMNDIIESRLYLSDGEKNYVSNVDYYSVGTYAYSQLNKTSAKESLKYLCADLLRYGAAAQTYKQYRLDALVDAEMTDAHKAYLSDIDAVTFGSNKGDLADFTNNGVAWVGRALDLNSKVIVRFVFRVTDTTLNPADLSAKITYVNYEGETVTKTVEGAVVYSAANNLYSFDFDGLLAAELRTVMNAVIYNGETRLSSTSVYSVDTYGNGTTGDMNVLCKALIAYSDTALAYFNAG